MAAIGRRPQVIRTSSDVLLFWSEAAQQTFPSISGSFVNKDEVTALNGGTPLPPGGGVLSNDVWTLGTRLTYVSACNQQTSVPTPVLVLNQNVTSKATPWSCYPLHNATDFTVQYDPKTQLFHCFWYWNGWSDDQSTLPAPPTDRYAPHSVPNPLTPTWLGSVVPRASVPPIDLSRTFWVAPIVDQFRYDYFPGQTETIKVGESKANGGMRMPDTPGSRKLINMINRGLISYPGPPEALLGRVPSQERWLWETTGGIVSAGRHLSVASQQDTPTYVPSSAQTGELQFLPDRDQPIPVNATIEDHLLIVQALKAHYDHQNIEQASRILMYSRGVMSHMDIETRPKGFIDRELKTQSPLWPSEPLRASNIPFLILQAPTVVGDFSINMNYRLTVNPTVVIYPVMGGAATTFYSNQDGYVISTSTPESSKEPSVDYTLHDPTPAWGKNAGYYSVHLAVGSF